MRVGDDLVQSEVGTTTFVHNEGAEVGDYFDEKYMEGKMREEDMIAG